MFFRNCEPLGADERFYLYNLPAIIPRFKNAPSKKVSHAVKTEIGIKPEMEENLDALFRRWVWRVGGEIETEKRVYVQERGGLITIKVPTPYGSLRRDVIKSLSFYSECKLIRYGSVESKELIFIFLINHLSWRYPEIALKLGSRFTLEERKKILEGRKILLKNIGRRIGVTIKSTDKFAIEAYDADKWRRCFDEGIPTCAIPSIIAAAEKLTNRIVMKSAKNAYTVGKVLTAPKTWMEVLSVIYTIRCMEKIVGMRIFKEDSELRRVFGIPRKTYREKMALLDSLFETGLAQFAR